MNQYEKNLNSSRGNANALVNLLVKGADPSAPPALTAYDLYGEQIQRGTDSLRAGANATKSALSRTMMAGGDISGAGGVGMAAVDQGAAEALQKLMSSYTGMASNYSLQREAQSRNALESALSATMQQYGYDFQAQQAALQRALLKRQARANRWANLAGAVLGAGATIATGGIAGLGAGAAAAAATN